MGKPIESDGIPKREALDLDTLGRFCLSGAEDGRITVWPLGAGLDEGWGRGGWMKELGGKEYFAFWSFFFVKKVFQKMRIPSQRPIKLPKKPSEAELLRKKICQRGPGLEPWVTEHSQQPILAVAFAPSSAEAQPAWGEGGVDVV